MNIKFKPTFLIIPVIFFLQACAVLTLDVDVYKGPLANDEDVLTQQTTVMATGAKPLLIQLRDTQEISCLNINKYSKKQIRNSATFQRKSDTSNGYISNHTFCDRQAKTVNEILSLYNDRKSDIFKELIHKGKKAIHKFETNQKILFPKPETKLEEEYLNKIWKNYKKSLRPEILANFDCIETNPCPNILVKARVKLAKAYEGFILGNHKLKDFGGISRRNIKGIFDAQKDLESLENNLASLKMKIASLKKEDLGALNKMLESLNLKYLDSLKKEDLDALKKNLESLVSKDFGSLTPIPSSISRYALLDDTIKPSVTSQFMALTKSPKVIEWHANNIFADEFHTKFEKTDFVNHIQRAAQSFIDSRYATQELLDVSLHLLSIMSIKGYDERHLADAVTVTVNLIRAKYLWKALNEVSDKNPGILELFDNLKQDPNVFQFRDRQDYDDLFPKGDPTNAIYLKTALTNLLLNKVPVNRWDKNNVNGRTYRHAQAIMELNQRYINKAKREPKNVRGLFSITMGPIDNVDAFMEATRVAKTLSTKLAAGGLERGRLNDGLDTLIEGYLKETEKYPRNPILTEIKRKQLFDGLVRFAQKVLFIANNQSLFTDSTCVNYDNPEQNCSQRSYQVSSETKTDIGKYTQVLQAVGNSILYQVDELRIKGKHNRKLEEDGPREARALKRALPNYSEMVLIKLIEGLENDFKIAKTNFDSFGNLANAQKKVQEAGAKLKFTTDAKEKAEKEKSVAETTKTNWEKINTFLKDKVSIISDEEIKDRTFKVKLINNTKNAELGAVKEHSHIITNSIPVVFFPGLDTTLPESESPPTIKVALSHPAEAEVTVDVKMEPQGIANAEPATVIIKKGQTEATDRIKLTIVDTPDDITDNKQLKLTLENPNSAAQLGASDSITYIHTIKDDDGLPTVGFETASSKGLEDQKDVTFKVILSKTPKKDITLKYTVNGNKATNKTEFDLDNGEIKFERGQLEKKVSAQIIDIDGDNPDNKSFTITLALDPASAAFATLERSTHTYSIIDNDGKPKVYFESKESSSDEGTTRSIQVKLSNAYTENLKVDYTVINDDAKAGKDFELENGSITFATGSVTPDKAIKPTLKDNDQFNGNRSFTIKLIQPQQDTASLGPITEHKITIVDNEKALPELQFQFPETRSAHGKAVQRNIPVILNNTRDTIAQKDINQKYQVFENDKLINDEVQTLIIKKGAKPGEIKLDIVDPDLQFKEVKVKSPEDISFSGLVDAISEKIKILKDISSDEISLLTTMLSEVKKLNTESGDKKRQEMLKSILLITQNKFDAVEKDLTVKTDTFKNATNENDDADKTQKATQENFVKFQDALKKKNAAEVARSNKLNIIKYIDGRDLGTENPQVVQGQVVQFLKTELQGVKSPPPSLPTVEFESASSRTLESETPPTLNVKLSKKAESTIYVKYEAKGPAKNGVKESGNDFQLKKGVLVFPKGIVSLPITGLKIHNNTVDDNDRAFTIKLSEPSEGTKLGNNQEHVYRIIDDDGVPSVYFDVVKSAGEEEITPAKIKVQISNSPSKDVTIKYVISKKGTAKKDVDYTLDEGIFTFAKNTVVDKIINANINKDNDDKGDETIVLKLSTPSDGLTLTSHSEHTYTIKSNEGGERVAPSPTIANDEKKKLKDAIELVQAQTPQMSNPLPPMEENLDTKQVMDQLIDTLKYEHIHAVREGKKGTTQHLEEALDAANNYRADMIAIRPAFAYLRNSFPSSSLQDDASLGWTNMLSERMWRGLFGECPDCDERNRKKINREIDKQYWQNINRVRVSGGGNTNYVISKDDVGNWSVKNYSADPGPIIKSAKNLALFGMSGGVGENLIARNNAPKAPDETTLPNANKTPPTFLERQIAYSKNKFNANTKKDLDAVKGEMKLLPTAVELKWKNDPDVSNNIASKPEVSAAKEKLVDTREKVTKGDQTEGELIEEHLASILTYYKEVATALNKQKPAAGGPANEITSVDKALEILKTEVTTTLEGLIGKRLKTVEAYETTINDLNEVLSEPPVSPAPPAPVL